VGPVLAGAALFLALMVGLFGALEVLAPATARPWNRRAMALGAGLFVLDTLVMQAVGAPLLAWLAARFEAPVARTLTRAALVFVASDLCGYWVHRAMHRVPWLWRFHRLHHEATELSFLDAWRQHPVDFVLHGVVVGLPGAFLGLSLSELGSVVLLRKTFTTFLHANLAVSFGRVLASPAFHAVHHSADARDFDTNFAGTFPLWDVLFGTWSEHRAPRPASPGVGPVGAAGAVTRHVWAAVAGEAAAGAILALRPPPRAAVGAGGGAARPRGRLSPARARPVAPRRPAPATLRGESPDGRDEHVRAL
jgi:sterol desaturase/sphingolipid hydroxylase (fatty acid hydroxylase superfamily)